MDLSARYKQTEAGILPEDWEVMPLGGFVRITSGVSPSLLRFSGIGIPYFKVEQLSNTEKYLDATDTPYLFERGQTVPRHSVIFAKRGAAIALNKVRILRQPSFMDTNLMALMPLGGLEPEYLFYQLGHIGLWKFADTASVPQINNKHIHPLLFPLPSAPEQRAIAEALSDVDALLGGLDRLIAKKRDLKQAAMQQLLSGQTRLPGFSGEREVRRLGEVADTLKGSGLSKDQVVPHGLHPCILYGELFTTYDRVISTVVSRTNSVGGCASIAGDVLIPASTTTSGIDLATASALLEDAVALGGDINIIRRRSDFYDPAFLAHYLSTVRRDQIAELTQGITIHHLYGRELRALELELPTLEEQIAIATVLADMGAELETIEARRAKTRDLKQAMMQELLTGKTRLRNVEDGMA